MRAYHPREEKEMSARLDGKIALITGAASGMGAAQARLFASEGAAVCVADINDAGGQELVASVHR